jgi:tetratricopeptide (TPR) repeat protein
MPARFSQYCLGDSEELEGHVARLRLLTEQLGPGHPQTVRAANTAATAFWLAGYIEQAIVLLDQALGFVASAFGPEHPIRADLLSTLGEIFYEQRHLEQAQAIQREVLEHRIRYSGPNHSTSLTAKNDLAAVLYELGRNEEASRFEQEAFEAARTHLGKSHPVTCVLAWNRAMSCERGGDVASAQGIIATELVWLLAAEPSCLEPEQNTIRSLLERRVNWGAAATC